MARGKQHDATGYMASLTPRQVRWARRQWESRNSTQKQIAMELGVSQPTISNVILRRYYRGVK